MDLLLYARASMDLGVGKIHSVQATVQKSIPGPTHVSEVAEMKSHRILTMASLASLIAAGVPLSARAATPDQIALRSRVEAELAAVTVDVDQANILFSPVDDGDGPNFAKVLQYQREYMAGRQSFQDAKYSEALQHLRKADEIIRSRPNWTEFR